MNGAVGGTLTHFAAPPVLMVASRWGWDTPHMIENFGWKAMAAILCANTIYFFFFRSEFARMRRPERDQTRPQRWSDRTASVPISVTVRHLLFLGWAVFDAHYPARFIGRSLVFPAGASRAGSHRKRMPLKIASMGGAVR